jgi:hypothetical protein
MKINTLFRTLLLGLACSMQVLGDGAPDAVLDALHKAGADADQAAFVAQLTPDVVFLGLDGAGRLEGQLARDYFSASFGRGVAWAYRSSHRETRLSPDGTVAWFDESLEQDQLGSGRGTGVLIHNSQGWKLAQYNLTVPLPNGSAVQSPEAAAGLVPQDSATAPAKKKQCWKSSHKTNMQAKC